MKIARIAALALVASLFVASASAGLLEDVQQRYKKDDRVEEKHKVIAELAACGKAEGLKALEYCTGISRSMLDQQRKDAEKAHAALVPLQNQWDELYRNYVEEYRKKNGGANPAGTPQWPVETELLKAQAEARKQEKAASLSEEFLGEIIAATGALVTSLPADLQKQVKDDWTKTKLSSKDWAARSEGYQFVGRTKTDWATQMLVLAAMDNGEPDPRVLVVVIDGLAGRDPKLVMQPLLVRLDDVRWSVRVAAVAAIEDTPCKEGIDAIVKRMPKEEGRLKDDCARALRALTGGNIKSNPEAWRLWWEKNREAWKGKPPAPDPDKPPPPFEDPKPAAAGGEEKGKTASFFGIEIQSKRVVFVIDVSGSMNTAIGGYGPDAKLTRIQLARRELKQVITGLADGTLFDVIFFSSAVRAWKPDLQKADVPARREAQELTDKTEAIGATNTFDALEAAFNLGDLGKGKKRDANSTGDATVDTIVFLSDGKPTMGRSIDPDAIRAAVREWNRTRRIAIHAIAFGVADKAGADPKFMRGLADDSGGSYRDF